MTTRTDRLPDEPMDAYQAANIVFNQPVGSPEHNSVELADIMAKEMQQAGYVFTGYNDCGEYVMARPKES